MQYFIGLIVHKPLTNKDRFLQSMKQMKHYLSFQTSLIIHDTQHIITIKASNSTSVNSFSLVKNPLFLHTQYQYGNIQVEQDYVFVQTCYEVLTIIKEYFASHIQIQLKIVDQIDEQSEQQIKIFDFLKNLEHIKQQQFSRRVISNLKSSIESNHPLNKQDIQNYLYLIENHYNRKAKSTSLKILASNRVPLNEWALVSNEDAELIYSMVEDEDYRLSGMKILENIQMAKKQLNDQNSFRQANKFQRSEFKNSSVKQSYQRPFVVKEVSKQTSKSIKSSIISQNYSIKTLMFQLKQSTSIGRIAKLLNAIRLVNTPQKYLFKLDQTIQNICQRYVSNQYKGQENSVKQFYQSLIQFLQKRGQCGVSPDILQKVEKNYQRFYEQNSQLSQSIHQ